MSTKGKRARSSHEKPLEATAPEARKSAAKESTAKKKETVMNTHVNESINQVEKVTQNLIQACEEASTTAREHLDAAMRSASVAWEGYTEINKKVSGLVQESFAR